MPWWTKAARYFLYSWWLGSNGYMMVVRIQVQKVEGDKVSNCMDLG
jgi:hypothetical protein